jgi:adenosylmethionine-8-amino-7-oxononanoate aminotransferase
MFSRVRGDVICLAPPIITPDGELDRVVSITADSVRAVLG